LSAYRDVLGASFESLPPACQKLHSGAGRYDGEITVESALGSLVRLLGFPAPVTSAPFSFEILEDGKRDIWIRSIAGQATRSVQWASADKHLCERMGGLCAHTNLTATPQGLEHEIVKMQVLGLPIPKVLWPGVAVTERDEAGRYDFSVTIKMPIIGIILVSYRGWLDVL